MKPRRTLVEDMLRVHASVERLVSERPQAEYTNADMRSALGHTPTPAEGACLGLMGWRRAMRMRQRRWYRAWIPPQSLDT